MTDRQTPQLCESQGETNNNNNLGDNHSTTEPTPATEQPLNKIAVEPEFPRNKLTRAMYELRSLLEANVIPVIPVRLKTPLVPKGYNKPENRHKHNYHSLSRAENATGIAAIFGTWGNGKRVLDIDIDGESAIPIALAITGYSSLEALLADSISWKSPRPGRYHVLVTIPDSVPDFHEKKVKDYKGIRATGTEKVELRFDGCYSVLPPSQYDHEGYTGSYDYITPPNEDWSNIMPAPESLVQHLNDLLTSKKTKVSNSTPDKLAKYFDDFIKRGATRVAEAKPGTRMDTLNKQCYIMGGHEANGLNTDQAKEALLRAANDNGLLEDEGEAEIAKIIDDSLHAGSLKPLPAPPVESNSTRAQLVQILEEDYARNLHYNTLSNEIYWNGQPLDDVIEIANDISKHRDFDGSLGELERQVLYYAQRNSFSPVEKYLTNLPQWDGVDRVPELAACLGVTDQMNILQFRYWLTGTARRGLEPGCQFDNVLILVGAQGAKKTSFFRVMGREFYKSLEADCSDGKDGLMGLQSGWIVEYPELETVFGRKQNSAMKSMITSTTDSFRLPYARKVTNHPRQCVIVGTTNESEGLLSDPTGSRRFWVIEVCDNINLEGIKAIRDQIWAQAVAAVKAGEKYWFEAHENKAVEDLNKKFQMHDLWETEIFNCAWDAWRECKENFGFTDTDRPFVTMGILLRLLFHGSNSHHMTNEVNKTKQTDVNRLTRILKQEGFVHGGKTRGKKKHSGQFYPWFLPEKWLNRPAPADAPPSGFCNRAHPEAEELGKPRVNPE